jgi:hypothetical protein
MFSVITDANNGFDLSFKFEGSGNLGQTFLQQKECMFLLFVFSAGHAL